MPPPLAASGVTFRRQREHFVPSNDYSAAGMFQTAQARTPSYQVQVPQQASHAEVAEGYQAELAALQRRALQAEQLCEQQAALLTNIGGRPLHERVIDRVQHMHNQQQTTGMRTEQISDANFKLRQRIIYSQQLLLLAYPKYNLNGYLSDSTFRSERGYAT